MTNKDEDQVWLDALAGKSGADADPEVMRRANLLRQAIQRHDAAYRSLQSALSILENLGLAEDQRAASVINHLALINLHNGLYEEAITLFQRSLDIDEKSPDKSTIAPVLSNLSEVYRELGKLDKALLLAKNALEILEKSGGKESNRATIVNNLGLIYQSQGNYAEALKHFQKSLALVESTLGKSHVSWLRPVMLAKEKRQSHTLLATTMILGYSGCFGASQPKRSLSLTQVQAGCLMYSTVENDGSG